MNTPQTRFIATAAFESSFQFKYACTRMVKKLVSAKSLDNVALSNGVSPQKHSWPRGRIHALEEDARFRDGRDRGIVVSKDRIVARQ